jgi:predicted  nucleic acid-binding Zn-ribbon protein
MPKQQARPLEALSSIDAPAFIEEFHSAAIQSVSTMAGAFTGLAKAFQTQNERSDHLEAQVLETNNSIKFMRGSIEQTEKLVKDLAAQIESQLQNINERFEQHGKEFDEKLSDLDGEIRNAISEESKKLMKQMMKECKKLVQKVASAVKNTESQLKSLTKSNKDNQNKIQKNKGAIERIENDAKALKENLKNEMSELNTYVEKTTSDMKDLVEHTSENLTSKVEDLDKRNQEFKFETNQALDRKADVDDLKRNSKLENLRVFEVKLIFQYLKNISSICRSLKNLRILSCQTLKKRLRLQPIT